MTRRELAAVLIVKNEERCLSRCLDSLDGVVDRIVVLDTGSTDSTIQIARAHGAAVGHFKWCDDFAAARNAALDLADADWNLILDADEWLVGGGAALRGQVARRPVEVGTARIVSTSIADGVPVSSTTVSERLLPRGVRYLGAVHEQPVHDFPIRALDLTIGHDGYEPAQVQQKRGRNERLLRQALRTRPRDAYLRYQLAKDLQAQARYVEAADAFEMACAAVPPHAPWHHSLVVRAVSVYGKTGRFGDAIALMDAENTRWDGSPDWHFALGNVFLDMALARPESAGELLPLIEASWLRCLEIGDRPDLDGSVAGRGSHLAAQNLAGFYESLGESEAAGRYRRLAGIRGGVSPIASGTTGTGPM